MNAVVQPETSALAVRSASAGALLMDGASMERLERIANLMASGKTTVPAHLRGSAGDCFAITLQSMQWGMNPFAVAQKTHLVNGTLGYEAQLVAAVINTSGAVKDRFHFDWYGPWEKVIGKFIIKKSDKGEYRQPGWTLADEEGCGVRVWATLRGETEPRTLEILLAQARVRNSTLWADDPKQQLAYLAQKRWSRLYAPDVILGVYTPDEMTQPGETFMGMADLVAAPPPPGQPNREAWTDDAFNKRLPKWQTSIDKGTSAEEIIGFVESKSVLSEEQKATIRALKPTAVAEPKTGTKVTFAQVSDGIRLATNAEQLAAAADLIGEVADPQQRAELTAEHDARQFDLS